MNGYPKAVAAAILMTTTLSAVEVTSFSGDTRFYYGTDDAYQNDLFNEEGAMGQFAVAADLKLKFTDIVNANLGLSYLSSLGLDDVLYTYPYAGGTTKDQLWLDEINLDIKLLEGTDLRVGRQYIVSPMLYSIDWNIVST